MGHGREGEREKHVFTERGHFLWRCLSLIANDRGRGLGRASTHEYCPRATRLRLCSCVHSKEKVGHPSIHPSTSPPILYFGLPTLHCLHPPNFSPFLLSFSPRPFLILTWLSVRPSVRQHKPGQVVAVCLPLKRPHFLVHSFTH